MTSISEMLFTIFLLCTKNIRNQNSQSTQKAVFEHIKTLQHLFLSGETFLNNSNIPNPPKTNRIIQSSNIPRQLTQSENRRTVPRRL